MDCRRPARGRESLFSCADRSRSHPSPRHTRLRGDRFPGASSPRLRFWLLLYLRPHGCQAPKRPPHRPLPRLPRAPRHTSRFTPTSVPAKSRHPPRRIKQLLKPAKPVEPEPPHWPANDKPNDASVTWDSKGLRIEADNSSLQQILKDVSAATGAKVEGLGADQRIFGDYGPGQANVVLSQLLEGSGYNVIMIGDQGEGTPRQIVLSSRNATSTQAAAAPALPTAAANEEEAEPEEQSPADQPESPVSRHGAVRHPPQP